MDTNLSLIFATILVCCLSTSCNAKTNRNKNCTDMFGINVKEGEPYLPGPSKCELCKCLNQKPVFCKIMPCVSASPPKRCITWTEECCEYTCHEYKEEFSIFKWVDNYFFPPSTTPMPYDSLLERPL